MSRLIKLTANEARILFEAAIQMEDEIWSITYENSERVTERGKRNDANKAFKNFESAIEKIRTCFK